MKNFKQYLKPTVITIFGFILGVITVMEYPSLFGNNIIVQLEQKTNDKNNDSILAEGKNVKVYESELKQKLQSLNPDLKDVDLSQIPQNTKTLLIDEIAGQKIIFKTALKENIQNEKYIQDELNNYAQNIIKARYLEKFIKESVTEENVKSVYNQLKAELDGKNEIKVSHILLSDKQEANSIYKKVRYDKKRFHKIAKNKSLDEASAANGGSLGYIIEGQMIKEFEDQVFSAKKGQILKPFKTSLGWHIALIEDKRKAQAATFEQARNNIINELTKNSIKSHVLELLKSSDFHLIQNK